MRRPACEAGLKNLEGERRENREVLLIKAINQIDEWKRLPEKVGDQPEKGFKN